MAATEPTELAMAQVRLVIRRDVLRALEHLDRLRRPERECIDRAARPRTARPTMAIAHCIGLAGYAKLDCAAEARTPIRTGHDFPLMSRVSRADCISREHNHKLRTS